MYFNLEMPKRIIQLKEKGSIDEPESQYLAVDSVVEGTSKIKAGNLRDFLMPPFASSTNYLTEDYSVPAYRNVVTVVPLHIPSGVTLHVPETSHFYILDGEPNVDNQEPVGPSQVLMGFAEAIGDISNSIAYMWLANSDNAELKLRYRPIGSVTWQDVPCQASGFWLRTERVHRARIFGLLPNTTYELRPWGAPLSDIRRIRTAPQGFYEPKIIHLSDYQTNNYTPGATLDTMSAMIANHLNDTHLIVAGGDYVNDNGLHNNSIQATRWMGFLANIDKHFKRADGTLVPWVWLAGNHEVVTNYSNIADPENPVSPPGWLADLFQFLWDPTLPNNPIRGHGWLKLGPNLLLVFLDSNHSSFLTDQVTSFANILAEHASSVRHVCVVSHVSPWRGQNSSDAWIAHRQLRRDFLPVAQTYPNFKFWLAGHDHNLAATFPIKAVPETGNEYKWQRDLVNGVVTLGNGGWATVSTGNLANTALTSPVDGTLMYQAYIISTTTFGLENPPTVPPTSSSPYVGALHFWKLSFGESSAVAIATSSDDKTYKTITQTLS